MTKGRRYLARTAAILVPIAIAAALWIARRADPRALPAGSFRVHVQDVIKDNNARVVQLDIEARASSSVRIDRDGPGRTIGVRMPEAVPPDPPWWSTRWPLSLVFKDNRSKPRGQDQPATRMKMTVLCDHLGLSPDLLKFQLNIGCPTGGWGVLYDNGAFPKGKSFEDVISIGLESGTYREGMPQPLLSFKGRSYRLVVDAPKP